MEVVCWGLSTLVVQFFYAWRIWTISQKQVIIPALVIISAITQLSMCYFTSLDVSLGLTCMPSFF